MSETIVKLIQVFSILYSVLPPKFYDALFLMPSFLPRQSGVRELGQPGGMVGVLDLAEVAAELALQIPRELPCAAGKYCTFKLRDLKLSNKPTVPPKRNVADMLLASEPPLAALVPAPK